MSKQKQKNNFCTQHVVNLYFSGNSMNNLLSYCGLTDARIRASEKDLPVLSQVDTRGPWTAKIKSPFFALKNHENQKFLIPFFLH